MPDKHPEPDLPAGYIPRFEDPETALAWCQRELENVSALLAAPGDLPEADRERARVLHQGLSELLAELDEP